MSKATQNLMERLLVTKYNLLPNVKQRIEVLWPVDIVFYKDQLSDVDEVESVV